MKNLYLGIDPGISGAFAIIDSSKSILTMQDVPTTERRGKNYFDAHAFAEILKPNSHRIKFALLEDVGAAPKQGVVSTFRFGHATGQINGVLSALDIEIKFIKPAVWKMLMNVESGKETSMLKVKELFPNLEEEFFKKKGNHNMAEALLLAYIAVDRLAYGG